MGRRLQEEQVLAAAKVIDELIRSKSSATSLL